QALAVIRQEPSQARQVAQLRAALEQEGINVEQARRDLLRKQSLFAKGFISRNDLENAQQDARRARVRRQLAERELLLALGGSQELFLRYVSQDPSTTRLEEFRVYSPSGGTVIDVNVQPGEIITSGTATVGGGTVLMKLADITKMVAKAKINEVNIARVQVGQPVTVHLDAIPGSLFEGTVTVIAPQGEKDESIVTYEVTIEIENVGLSLRPMMTANIDILTDDLDNVITIPLETLQSEEGDDVVYVEENGERVRRKVRVVLRTESEAVVVQGLEEGDRVILPSYTESPSRR
ncbi:MAG: efflux RND transporter periplasmic adaptor subunit, partial [Nitrospirota bacterium]|nr:efflux RND transporter periplasmic adaptor subunit [Nitrospirota bacterium]